MLSHLAHIRAELTVHKHRHRLAEPISIACRSWSMHGVREWWVVRNKYVHPNFSTVGGRSIGVSIKVLYMRNNCVVFRSTTHSSHHDTKYVEGRSSPSFCSLGG